MAVKDIVETQLDFRLIEARVAADRVVEEEVAHPERMHRNDLVISTVIVPALSDALAEESRIECLLLVGEACAFGIVRSERYPGRGRGRNGRHRCSCCRSGTGFVLCRTQCAIQEDAE